jgi:tetratricopeptide (TPR) repeat protein
MTLDYDHLLQEVSRLSDSGREEEALSLLNQLRPSAETDDERASLLLAESRCLARLDKVAESQQRLKVLAKLKNVSDVISATSQLMMACNLKLQDQNRKALKLLTEIPRQYPEAMREQDWLRHDVNAEIAFTLALLRRPEQAISELSELDSENEDVEFKQRKLLCLADCNARIGNYALARDQLAQILSLSSEGRYAAEAHLHLATLDVQNRSYARARYHLDLFERDRHLTKMPQKIVDQLNAMIKADK